MAKYQEIEYEGRVYRYCEENGTFYDEHFIVLSLDEINALSDSFFRGIDYSKYTKEDLRTLILRAKGAGNFVHAEIMCEYAMGHYQDDLYFIRQILPIYTSVLRASKRPSKAIAMYDDHQGKTYESPALLTSIAAAYLDIDDLANGEKLAKKAYEAGGFSPELAGVFERIKNLKEKRS